MVERKPIILASQSPRRIELMKRLGLDFIVRPSLFDENSLPKNDPVEFASNAALGKAREVLQRLAPDEKNAVLIGVDTIVFLEGNLLLKPVDEGDAFRLLRMLSGQTHRVTSAVAFVSNCFSPVSFYENTQVTFRELSDEEIRDYIATGSPMDKAGAYGIQDAGRDFVKAFAGDFFNVMGLPVARLVAELAQVTSLPEVNDLYKSLNYSEK